MSAAAPLSLDALERTLSTVADPAVRGVLAGLMKSMPGALAAARDAAERRAAAALAVEAEQRRALEQRVAALEAQLGVHNAE